MNRIMIGLLLAASSLTTLVSQERTRVRELGVDIGIFETGALNAITDVAGVLVGHTTLVRGDSVRTGVTAILPHGGNLFTRKVAAAVYVGNGFGKLIGSTQVEELGVIETPVVLTNTLSVWTAAEGVVEYELALPENAGVGSINPVVGETNDGHLNDIRGRHVTRADVIAAIQHAHGGEVEEGCVGAGTGTVCFGWKGGIGTSSRVLPKNMGTYTVGALVQTNFGGILDVAGVPVGKELGKHAFKERLDATRDGSCMIVVATDAPLDARQLKRLAKRATLALGRTGSMMSHGSGDYVIAFSTTGGERTSLVEEESLTPLFQAVVEATEEAILNSLCKATTTSGRRGRMVEALPLEDVRRLLNAYGRSKQH